MDAKLSLVAPSQRGHSNDVQLLSKWMSALDSAESQSPGAGLSGHDLADLLALKAQQYALFHDELARQTAIHCPPVATLSVKVWAAQCALLDRALAAFDAAHDVATVSQRQLETAIVTIAPQVAAMRAEREDLLRELADVRSEGASLRGKVKALSKEAAIAAEAATNAKARLAEVLAQSAPRPTGHAGAAGRVVLARDGSLALRMPGEGDDDGDGPGAEANSDVDEEGGRLPGVRPSGVASRSHGQTNRRVAARNKILRLLEVVTDQTPIAIVQRLVHSLVDAAEEERAMQASLVDGLQTVIRSHVILGQAGGGGRERPMCVDVAVQAGDSTRLDFKLLEGAHGPTPRTAAPLPLVRRKKASTSDTPFEFRILMSPQPAGQRALRPLPFGTWRRYILQLYIDKAAFDRGTQVNQGLRLSAAQYAAEFLNHKYGLPSLADLRMAEMITSVRSHHAADTRTRIMDLFIGAIASRSDGRPVLGQLALDFVTALVDDLRAARLISRERVTTSSNAASPFELDGTFLLPRVKALHIARARFAFARRGVVGTLSAQIACLPPPPSTPGDGQWVDIDAFLRLCLVAWAEEQLAWQGRIAAVWDAAATSGLPYNSRKQERLQELFGVKDLEAAAAAVLAKRRSPGAAKAPATEPKLEAQRAVKPRKNEIESDDGEDYVLEDMAEQDSARAPEAAAGQDELDDDADGASVVVAGIRMPAITVMKTGPGSTALARGVAIGHHVAHGGWSVLDPSTWATVKALATGRVRLPPSNNIVLAKAAGIIDAASETAAQAAARKTGSGGDGSGRKAVADYMVAPPSLLASAAASGALDFQVSGKARRGREAKAATIAVQAGKTPPSVAPSPPGSRPQSRRPGPDDEPGASGIEHFPSPSRPASAPRQRVDHTDDGSARALKSTGGVSANAARALVEDDGEHTKRVAMPPSTQSPAVPHEDDAEHIVSEKQAPQLSIPPSARPTSASTLSTRHPLSSPLMARGEAGQRPASGTLGKAVAVPPPGATPGKSLASAVDGLLAAVVFDRYAPAYRPEDSWFIDVEGWCERSATGTEGVLDDVGSGGGAEDWEGAFNALVRGEVVAADGTAGDGLADVGGALAYVDSPVPSSAVDPDALMALADAVADSPAERDKAAAVAKAAAAAGASGARRGRGTAVAISAAEAVAAKLLKGLATAIVQEDDPNTPDEVRYGGRPLARAVASLREYSAALSEYKRLVAAARRTRQRITLQAAITTITTAEPWVPVEAVRRMFEHARWRLEESLWNLQCVGWRTGHNPDTGDKMWQNPRTGQSSIKKPPTLTRMRIDALDFTSFQEMCFRHGLLRFTARNVHQIRTDAAVVIQRAYRHSVARAYGGPLASVIAARNLAATEDQNMSASRYRMIGARFAPPSMAEEATRLKARGLVRAAALLAAAAAHPVLGRRRSIMGVASPDDTIDSLRSGYGGLAEAAGGPAGIASSKPAEPPPGPAPPAGRVSWQSAIQRLRADAGPSPQSSVASPAVRTAVFDGRLLSGSGNAGGFSSTFAPPIPQGSASMAARFASGSASGRSTVSTRSGESIPSAPTSGRSIISRMRQMTAQHRPAAVAAAGQRASRQQAGTAALAQMPDDDDSDGDEGAAAGLHQAADAALALRAGIGVPFRGAARRSSVSSLVQEMSTGIVATDRSGADSTRPLLSSTRRGVASMVLGGPGRAVNQATSATAPTTGRSDVTAGSGTARSGSGVAGLPPGLLARSTTAGIPTSPLRIGTGAAGQGTDGPGVR